MRRRKGALRVCGVVEGNGGKGLRGRWAIASLVVESNVQSSFMQLLFDPGMRQFVSCASRVRCEVMRCQLQGNEAVQPP